VRKARLWTTSAKYICALIKLITKETFMKKSLIALLAITMAYTSNACDICGCGVGNFNPHMFPHFAQKFITFGYNYRYYQSNAHDDMGNEMLNKEYYHRFFGSWTNYHCAKDRADWILSFSIKRPKMA